VLVLLKAQKPPLATIMNSGATLALIFMLLDATVAETAEPSNVSHPCTSDTTRICTVTGENAVDGRGVARVGKSLVDDWAR
jgi:hypothetical protein